VWVQFRNIPFYLLTKKLARDLGDRVGTLLMIDEHSRGDICDKFLRARVQLPLYLALQKTITLKDEITEEEVEVQLRYERIPNFCLFCGYIGHMEARCDAPAEGRKLCFSSELRVRPVHFEDPRTWRLSEGMGDQQNQPPAPAGAIWRAPSPAPWPAPWRGVMPARGVPRTTRTTSEVETVTAKVANLHVQDCTNNSIVQDLLQADVGVGLDTIALAFTPTVPEEIPVDGNNSGKSAQEETVTQIINTGVTVPEVDVIHSDVQVPITNTEPAHVAELVTGDGDAVTIEEGSGSAPPDSKNKGTRTWKRNNMDKRSNEMDSKNGAQPLLVVYQRKKARRREEEKDMEDGRSQSAKKGAFMVPSLEQCLGAEVLNELRRAENELQAEEGKLEDAGPGDAGSLSGATDSTRQEP
jgi:hypothetical protein